MRLCISNGKKAFFHCFQSASELVEPSPMRNGHSGGIIRYTVAIVEYEDGTVESVPAENIEFQDTKKLMEKFDKGLSKWTNRQANSKQANENGLQGGMEKGDGSLESTDNSELLPLARAAST